MISFKQLTTAFLLSFFATSALAGTVADSKYEDLRYCGAPQRTSTGTIYRDRKVIRKFKEAHPCPVTGLTTGACPGWDIDHVIPLACGGCDAVSNMQWLPDALKNQAGSAPKDRWERIVYANPAIYDSPSCKFEVIKNDEQKQEQPQGQ